MKAKKFELQSKVCQTKNISADFPLYEGIVLAELPSGELVVEFQGTLSKINPADLCTSKEAQDLQAEMLKAKFDLESQFANVKRQIEDKIAQATVLLQEAVQLCGDNDEDLYSFIASFDNIKDIMHDHEIIWQSSSTSYY